MNGGRDKGDIVSNPPAAILAIRPADGSAPDSQTMPFSSTMPTSRFIMRLLLVVLAAAAVGVASYQRFLARESAQLADASSTRLDFYRSTLVQTLEEFRLLPEVLGMDSRVGELLAAPAEVASIGAVNRYLESVAHDPAIHAVFLIDAEGLTLASSNWRDRLSFVGHNYGFRPYFQAAMRGRPGRFYGVGVTTQEAGFFLSAPVRRAERVIGVMVVKIRLDALEDAWRRSGDLLLVSDRLGVVLLSSSPSWKFRSLLPISEPARARLAHTRQYLHADLKPLLAADGAPLLKADGSGRQVRLESEAQPFVQGGGQVREYLTQSQLVAPYEWRLLILSDLAEARATAMTRAVTVTLAVLLVLSAAVLWRMRRRRVQERIAARQALERIQTDLEARIAERTEALVAANRSLEGKVLALKDAEQILTRTRDAAVQAGKLAVLGQMSAGITHEINQPLAALTTLADNGARLVELGRDQEARENLHMIRDLAQRMGRIVAQLKTFARRGEGAPEAVAVAASISNVLRLLATRGLRPEISVRVEHRVPGLAARADPIRFEQVLLNLVMNAADAMEAQSSGDLSIVSEARDGHAVVTLRDNGPGIPRGVLPHLFEPFFTTKPAGKGLGLGLVISKMIIESLDGRLEAGNNAQCGAWFRVSLPLGGERSGDG